MININPSQDSNNVQCEQNISFNNIQSHQNETILGEHIEQHNTTRELQNSNHTNINDKKLEERTTHANVVPVITNAKSLSKGYLEKIYDVIAHYSFVTFLNPNNAFAKEEIINHDDNYYFTIDARIKINKATGTPNLSNEEKELLINDEEAFLTQKIKEVCKDATLLFIPKSLYQLLIYKEWLHNIFSTIQDQLQTTNDELPHELKNIDQNASLDDIEQLATDSRLFSRKLKDELREITDTAKSAAMRALFNPTTYKGTSEAARDYNKSFFTQIFFIELNQNISAFINEINQCSTTSHLTIDNLQKITENVIIRTGECIQAMQKQPLVAFLVNHVIEDITKDNPYHSFLFRLQKPTSGEIYEPEIDYIKKLITLEYEAPKNTYRIYRGELPSCDWINEESSSTSTSFSDGMFAGSVYDGVSGSAYPISKSGNFNSLTCVDIPKEYLLGSPKAQYFFIPPVLSLGATLGNGEHHHIRGKKDTKHANEKNLIMADFGGGTGTKPEQAPWLYSDDPKVFNHLKEKRKIEKINIEGTDQSIMKISFPEGL